jgi:SAM-dependent methyltransferase
LRKVLELGSGRSPYQEPNSEVIHLDMIPGPDIEVVMDLNTTAPLFGGKKLPFPNETFDHVRAFDIIEHVVFVVPLMEEIHRVLKDQGTLFIHTTNYKYPNAFRDPTHFHFFTLESFDYWDPSTPLGARYGYCANSKFKVLERKEDYQELAFTLQKIGPK